MWNDLPIQRKPHPVDIPPSSRAFLSPFNRSFTPPALINDPYAVDKKLTITPLLLGSRRLYVPRNPFAIDPAAERVRHYVGCENTTDLDLSPSPVLTPLSDIEWPSDEEEVLTRENVENTTRRDVKPVPTRPHGEKNRPLTVTPTVECSPRPKTPAAVESNNLQHLSDTEYYCAKDSSIPPCELLPLTGSNTPESQMHFCLAESDDGLDVNCKERSLRQTINSPASPLQSEGVAATSWDEWDDQSDMLSHIGPVSITGKLGYIQFNSLL